MLGKYSVKTLLQENLYCICVFKGTKDCVRVLFGENRMKIKYQIVLTTGVASILLCI